MSFIGELINLQELSLSFHNRDDDFKNLQYIHFSQLQILKFDKTCPNHEYLIKFLEINGKNLKVIHLRRSSSLLNSSIAKFCPKLKSLHTIFRNHEMKTLIEILNNCQQFESIKIWCGGPYLNENDLLEILIKHSSKNFHELKIFSANYLQSSFLKELNPFFTSWANRISRKSFSLIIIDNSSIFKEDVEVIEVIDKFKKLGVVKKFEIIKESLNSLLRF